MTEIDEQSQMAELATPLPSLRTNSAARLGSDVWILVMSLVAATVTARLLGPSGKGFYSSLLLLVGAFTQIFGAGIAEAAIVLAGQGRFSLQAAASATAGAILPLSALAVASFYLVATITMQPRTADERLAVLLAASLVGVMIWYAAAVWFLMAKERVVWAALLAILLATVTTLSLCAFLGLFDLRNEGAILAGVAGAATTLLGTLVLLRRLGLLARPQWVRGFLGPAVRLGAQLQVSSLLVTLSSRLDVVLVYRLRDAASAGSYSVALTIGTLVSAVPVAVSYASFPRLTRLDAEAARALTAQLFRVGMAAAMLAAVALGVITPVVVPLLFGDTYRSAIGPTLLLIPAGVLWSGQYLLARAAAARGDPKPLSVSFIVNFVTMIALDLILIGPFGALGAAMGTLIASAAGLATALAFYRRGGSPWAPLVPKLDDFAEFVFTTRGLVTGRQGR